MRHARIGTVALLLVALCAPACHRKAAAPRGRVEGLAARALDVLPQNVAFVGGASFASVRGSRLWGSLLEAARQDPTLAALDARVRDGCHIDVARDVQAVVIAGTALSDESRTLILLEGAWTEEQANTCLATVVAPAQGLTMTIKKDGPVTEYTLRGVAGEWRSYAAWIGPGTVLFAPYAAGDRTYLADVLSSKAPLAGDTHLVPLVRQVDTTATLWLAATGSDPMAADFLEDLTTPGGTKAAGLFLDVQLGDTLAAHLGVRWGAGKDARAAADKVRRELDEAKREKGGEFLRDSTVTVADRDLVVGVRLDAAQMTALLAQVQGYLKDLPGTLGLP